MNIRPTLEELKAYDTSKYTVAPVSTEIFSDFITPIEALRILKNVSTHTYMLESAQESDTWGRYTFLGFEPKLEISCINGEMKAGDITFKTENPTEYLRQVLTQYRSPKVSYLPPFTGGLVGYFSYDYLKYSEPILKKDLVDENEFKDVDLMLFDKVIAFDNVRQKIVLIANAKLADIETEYNRAVNELERIADLLKNGRKAKEKPGRILGEFEPVFNEEQYCDMVEKGKHYIFEGDIFQIKVLNETLTYEIDQIRTVLPYEMQDIQIEEGKDYCTLVTCTPYGVNTHRLLVRGHRIETVDDLRVSAEAIQMNQYHIALAIGTVLIIIVLAVWLIVSKYRSEKNKRKDTDWRTDK